MFKSMAVVVGSYLLSVVLVLAMDPLLSRLFPGDFEKGRLPSGPALMTSPAFFVVVSILCAWLCARFAPSRAARHVLWFFVIGEVMGIAAIIPNWSKGWPRGERIRFRHERRITEIRGHRDKSRGTPGELAEKPGVDPRSALSAVKRAGSFSKIRGHQ